MKNSIFLLFIINDLMDIGEITFPLVMELYPTKQDGRLLFFGGRGNINKDNADYFIFATFLLLFHEVI